MGEFKQEFGNKVGGFNSFFPEKIGALKESCDKLI
jgi:hypothetical protein